MKYEHDFYVTGAKVGKQAPRFDLRAIMPKAKESSLDQIQLDAFLDASKWVVLYFYPYNFTQDALDTIKQFDAIQSSFEAKNTVLIGVSKDSLHAHQAWQKQALGALNHFHASDNNLKLSEAYGILDEEVGEVAKAVFFIAPNGVLQAAQVYHAQANMDVEHTLKTLTHLQKTYRNND